MNHTSLIADKNTAGSIKRWINWAEADVEEILEEAQALIYQLARFREMKSENELSLAAGESEVTLPSRFLDPLSLSGIVDDDGSKLRFKYVTPETLDRNRVIDENGDLEEGVPYYWTIIDGKIKFNCKTDQDLTLNMIAYCSPALLAGGNPTNFLTDRYPHILRTACLAMAFDFKDDDAQYARQTDKLTKFVSNAIANDDLAYRGIDLTRDEE